MKRIALFLCLIPAISCFGQGWNSPANTDIYPAGPVASGLMKPAQAQISMYTGQAQVSIPIYTIEAGGLTIPISLDYSTGGIKLEEIATRTGLGWSLNAGGVISRTVRGINDDKNSDGYLYQAIPNTINEGDPYQLTQLENLCNNIIDWQPDEYFYNFLGHSGMFVYDDSDLVRFLPYENYIVTGLPAQKTFTITTDDGIKYSFNYIDSCTQTVNVNGGDDHESFYPNSWYLTKIEFPDKAAKISFYYGPRESYSQDFFQYSTEGKCDDIDENCQPDVSITPTHTNCTNDEAVLDSIVYPGGIVCFLPGAQRQDISGLNTLGSIVIKDAFHNILKSFKLKYSYFGSSGNLRLRLDEVVETDPNGNTLNPYKFLYNNSVSLPAYNTGSFDRSKAQDHWGYYNGAPNSSTIPVFLTCDKGYKTFGNANRSTDSLKERADILQKIIYPSQGSVKFDYEGNYYGYDDQGHPVYDTLPLPNDSVKVNVYATDNCPFHNCLDSASFNLACQGRVIINASYSLGGNTDASAELISSDGKIDIFPYSGIKLDTFLPTGKYTAYASVVGYTGQSSISVVYPVSCLLIVNDYKLAGGLRIHRVTYSDGDTDSSNDLIKIYHYNLPHNPARPSGNLIYAPVYTYNYEKVTSENLGGQTVWDSCKTTKGFSSSQATEENSKGGIVGYTDVDEIPYHHHTLPNGKDTLIADDGKIHYHFSFTPNLSWLKDFPFPPIYNNEYQRGNLLDEIEYDVHNNPVKKIHNHYLPVADQNYRQVHGIKAAFYKQATQINPPQISYEYYNYTSQFYCHDSTITTDYNLNDSTKSIRTGKTYFYSNPVHEQVTKTITLQSDGTIQTQYFKYAPDYGVHDYDGTGPMMQSLDQMSNYLHMHNVVIETYTTINKGGTDSVISGELTRYRMLNGKPVKDTIYQLDLQNPIPLSTFTVSNTTGSKFNRDIHYQPVMFYSVYDDSLMPITFYRPYDQHTVVVYNYPRYKPEAVAENAEASTMAYTSFEPGDRGHGWNYPPSAIESTDAANISRAATGNYLFSFSTVHITTVKPLDESNYILSFWYSQTSQTKSPASSISLSCPGMTILKITNGETIEEWSYVQYLVSFIPTGPKHQPSVDSLKITGGTNDLIDELRFYPAGAYMKTVAYNNVTDISGLCDENNVMSHFAFDGFERLNYSSDHYLNGLSYIEYHYKDTANSSDHNYIRTDAAHTLKLTETQLSAGTLANTQSTRTKQFFDGLGRTIQTISIQQSPSGQDIVTPIAYDAFDRTEKSYLPFPYSSGGNFVSGAIAAQSAFYSTTNDVVNLITHVAYAQDSFETSPLNRKIISAFPGESWEMNGANVLQSYRTNAANEVRQWIYNKSANTWTGNTFYLAGTLFVIEATDENGVKSKVYKDKNGNTVLEAHQKNTTSTITLDTNFIQTYYLFDNMLRLSMVITPQCMHQMEKSNNYTVTQTLANQLNFRYTYNMRSLMNGKKIPGQGWTYFVYDRLNRIVLTQDSNMRPTSKWLYQKYDVHGHQIISGIAVISGTRDQLQTNFWSSTTLYESRAPGTLGYTSNVTPQVGTNQIINYYDDYDFNDNSVNDYTPTSDSIARSANKLTGTFTLDLSSGVFERQANFYDYHYRTIETIGNNFENDKEHVLNQYDFNGNLLKTIHQHGSLLFSQVTSNLSIIIKNFKIYLPSYTVTHRYQYDFANRKTDEFITVNSHSELHTSEIAYNSLGKMKSKQLYVGRLGLSQQQMNYQYNIRGWLTDINDVNQLAKSSNPDYFAEKLHYDDGISINTGPIIIIMHGYSTYNGNISYAEWGTNLNGTNRQYYYDYDLLNRLKFAYYLALYPSSQTGPAEADRYDVSCSQYDDNGNIGSMVVKGVTNFQNNKFTYGTADNLTYTYAGNQVQKVSDAGQGAWSSGLDFRDGGNSGNDYTYDGNGNIISDQNKGITIAYNQLNLPQAITKNSTNNLNVTYDAAGNKLKEVNVVNSKKDSTSYFNDILEEKNGQKRILFGDGYIINKKDTLTNYFYERDHLGNIRIVFKGDSNLWNIYTLTMEPGHDSIGTGYGKFQNVDQYREAQEFYQGHFGAHLNQQSGPFIELPAHDHDSIAARVYYYYAGTNRPEIRRHRDSSNQLPPFSVGIIPAPQITNPDVHRQAPHEILSFGLNFGGLFNKHRNTGNNSNESSPIAIPNAYLDIQLQDSSGNMLQEWKQTISTQGNQWNILGDSFKVHISDTAHKKYKFHISLVNQDNADVWFDTLRIAQAQTTGPIVQVNDYYPYGNLIDGIMYQASGVDTNSYRYNGKKWEDGFNLNFYDYNKRWFDPQIGRFISIDGLADKFPNLTDYQYASDEPVKNVDLDGLEGVPSRSNGYGQYTAAQSSTWVKPATTLTARPAAASFSTQEAHLSAQTTSEGEREVFREQYNQQQLQNQIYADPSDPGQAGTSFLVGQGIVNGLTAEGMNQAVSTTIKVVGNLANIAKGAETSTKVIHFTSAEGVEAIGSGMLKQGTYVTLPSEVRGLSVSQVESALEIQSGRGAFSSTFKVQSSQLKIPANGSFTSGGKLQFQLTQPVTPQPFVPTIK